MHVRVLTLCLSLVVGLPVYSAQRSTPNTPREQPVQFQLNNPRSDVLIAYARISEEFGSNRSRTFNRLSPSMQADVWVLHLDFFLQDHEELTIRQRAVIYDAIRFIASGPFEPTQNKQSW